MSEIRNKEHEERIIDLINDMNLLASTNVHILERERQCKALGESPDIGFDSFYQQRRDVKSRIYQLLMNVDIKSSLFKDLVSELVPKTHQKDFLEKIQFHAEKIEMLLAG